MEFTLQFPYVFCVFLFSVRLSHAHHSAERLKSNYKVVKIRESGASCTIIDSDFNSRMGSEFAKNSLIFLF